MIQKIKQQDVTCIISKHRKDFDMGLFSKILEKLGLGKKEEDKPAASAPKPAPAGITGTAGKLKPGVDRVGRDDYRPGSAKIGGVSKRMG